jgi:hypothetical protein
VAKGSDLIVDAASWSEVPKYRSSEAKVLAHKVVDVAEVLCAAIDGDYVGRTMHIGY